MLIITFCCFVNNREDKGQFINLPLINTLRDQSFKNGDALGASTSKKKGKDDDNENKED